ncbi:GntR family transcriptional regulator [Vandammella animalimorsus]|uniref:GntR family transcriptional regulator n=1 Tax=Vandammella animalimorsus TaxID=2029117 RepID=UPI00325B3B54
MTELQGLNKASHGTANALSPPSFSPLYRQIKDLLLQKLQAGQWQPGQAIPSEMELSQQLRVSQGTVRKAIDELAAENLLVRRQGKGTFVATHSEQHVQYRFLRLRPDAGDLDEEGAAQRHILHCKRGRASAELAAQLGLRSSDAVVHIRRTLSMQGVPSVLEDIWLPGNTFKGISVEQIANYPGPTYALLEKEFGVRMVRAVEKLKAIASPDAETAALLQVPPGSPLLAVERLAYTYNDVPMEVRHGLYRTDTHHYLNELN